MKTAFVILAISLMLSACVKPTQEQSQQQEPKSLSGSRSAAALEAWVPENVEWDKTGPTSKPLVPGLLKSLPVQKLLFNDRTGTQIETAVWRPDVPEGVQVPIIMEAGPYFGQAIDEPLYGYWGDLIIDGLLPHGFAYAQVAVRGTSNSGGCQEFFSVAEQNAIDDAVTFYGEQPWSNGNVGLIGISYDGTTPFIAATFGNPHLKTIVPVDGLSSIYDHGFRNGTAWGGEYGIHAIYWTYGWEPEGEPMHAVDNTACPEGPRGVGTAAYSSLTGERDEPPVFDGYWEERDFKPRILENYQGSIFLVEGWLDWRVPPWLYFPFMQEAQAAGIETKMLLGQWWHDMPDAQFDTEPGRTYRWDFAEMLLRWFQRYLYESEGVNTGPAVHTEDSMHLWRTEENWPPTDATWLTFHLGDATLRTDESSPGEAVLFSPASAHRAATDRAPQGRGAAPNPVVEYFASTGALEEDLRFAGMPQFHVTFVPSGTEGARIYAELQDVAPDGTAKYVGQAVMDLRYYEGGYERHSLTPNQPIVAKMEFVPLDVMVPAGHELVLLITGAGYSSERLDRGGSGQLDQWADSTSTPVTLQWGAGKSTLALPTLERDVGDGTYPGQD